MKRPFQVCFVPITHHDLGYTQPIDELLTAYCGYYDDVLDFCDRTAGYPPAAQYRYSVEAFWSLDYYLRHTAAENRARLLRYVREGRIELPALYANVIDGLCPAEALARLLYPSAALAKEAGVSLKVASLTDIPGMSDGTIQALSQAGVRYLFAGFPQYFRWKNAAGVRPPVAHSYWAEDVVPWGHPAAFRWRSISGGEVFTWYQDGYGWFGDDAEALLPHERYEDIEKNLPRLVAQLEEKGVPYGMMRYIYRGSDNEAPNAEICDIVRRWNEAHEDIRLTVATNTMFFEALEARLAGETLPVLRGELPHTDYTTLSLSEVETTNLNARVKAGALDAEMLLTLAGRPEAAQMGEIFRAAALYDEHCFGLERPVGCANRYNRALKVNYALDAARKTEALWEKAAAVPQAAAGQYTLFSPCAGPGIAQTLAAGEKFGCAGGSARLRLRGGGQILVQRDAVDSPRLPLPELPERYAMRLPGQTLYAYTAAAEPDGLSLRQAEADGPAAEAAAPARPHVLENRFYRVELDPAVPCVRRIFDKELGADLTDGGAVGAVVNRDIAGGTCAWCRGVSLRRWRRGPVADSVIWEARADAAPEIVMELTLYHTQKRIDFAYRVVLDRTPLRELFVCFPFRMPSPAFSFQGGGGRVRAFDDIVPGGNTNQFAAGDYCAVSGWAGEIVLAARQPLLVSFGGMHPTAVSQAHHWLEPAGYTEPFVRASALENAHVYAMLAYNNCRTNFPAVQQGEALYGYALTSGRAVDAAGFACRALHPPVLLEGRCEEISIQVTGGQVLPVCWKPAEDGDGCILRLRETAGRPAAASVRVVGRTLRKMERCTLLEAPAGAADPGEIRLSPYEIATFRLWLETHECVSISDKTKPFYRKLGLV